MIPSDFQHLLYHPVRNYTDSLLDIIRCSFDPNDKLVNPVGPHNDSLSLLSNPLEYTIRFQNTGNDTAFLVTIKDTISPNFEYEYIQNCYFQS